MIEQMFVGISEDQVDFVITAIEADNGTVKDRLTENDGTTTIVAELPGDPPPEELPRDAPGVPWMAIAQGELGVTEGNNPRITEYFKTAGLGPEPDSVPWCSAFVNFCVITSGNEGTRSALARSWLQWGEESPDFIPGCVVVLARGDPIHGHVGFYVGRDANGALQLLGGNQSNAVNISSFRDPTVLGKRILGSANVKMPAAPAPISVSPAAGAGSDPKALLIKAMDDQRLIDNNLRAGIAAIAAVESDFQPRSEMSYSHTRPDRLRMLFGGRVADLDDAELATLARDDEAFFDRIYGGEFGRVQLGNTQPGDGFRFRGRGIFQLTGRTNYQRYGTMVGADLLGNPDVANDAATAAQLAVAYMRDRLRGNNFGAMKRAVGHSTPDIDQRKDQKFAEFLSSHEFDARSVA